MIDEDLFKCTFAFEVLVKLRGSVRRRGQPPDGGSRSSLIEPVLIRQDLLVLDLPRESPRDELQAKAFCYAGRDSVLHHPPHLR